MSTPFKGRVGQFGGSCSRYFVLYLGKNKIGDGGCQYIAKGGWPKLKGLNICLLLKSLGGCGVRE